jgi:hypothetical protein
MRDRAPRQRGDRKAGGGRPERDHRGSAQGREGCRPRGILRASTRHSTAASPAPPKCTYAWKVIEEAKAQMDRVRFLSIPDATPMDRLIVQHQAILDAIAAGQVAAAERTMRDHLSEILKSLPRLSRAFPDMFEDTEDAGTTRKKPARKKAAT